MDIRRIVYAAMVTGMIVSSIHAGDPTGACCYCDGCEVMTEADCGVMNGSEYQGDESECTAFCTDEIYMPDERLRALVQAKLGNCILSGFDIMKRLTDLDHAGDGINDLTGLEYASNLTILRLSNARVSDLSTLAGLGNLERIQLGSGEVTDLSQLAGLTNLEWLWLIDNQISDISPLAGLTNHLIINLANNCLDFESHCTYIPIIIENSHVIADPANCDCWSDLGADGVVGFDDLLGVLEHWQTCQKRGDANWDGIVDSADALAVLVSWGSCE